MGLAEWSSLVFLSVLWGGSFFFIEVALTEFTPLSIVALRVSIAASLIWVFVFIRGYPIPRSSKVWGAFLGMGLLNNVIPFVLIAWGQQEIASGLASILNAAAPIFTVIVAGILLKDEPVTSGKVIGAVLGLLGVTILIGPSAVAGFSTSLIAQLAVLAAALSYAFAGVYGRRFSSMSIHPVVAAAGQLLASTGVMIPIVFVFDNPSAVDSTGLGAWLAVIALAVLSTALAYVVYFRLLERAGATNLLLVTLLIPITAILLGYAILAEQLHAFHFVGIAVIGLGLSAIDGRIWQYFSQR
ncbi:MAG: DMT family transporter [Pseudomonadales bacterium]